MELIEIVVIGLAICYVLLIVGIHLYKKHKGLPTGECAACAKGSKKLLKKYHKMYKVK